MFWDIECPLLYYQSYHAVPTFEASFRGFIISSYLVATKFKCNNKKNKTNIKKTFRQSQEVRFGVPSTRIDTCLNDRAVAVVFSKFHHSRSSVLGNELAAPRFLYPFRTFVWIVPSVFVCKKLNSLSVMRQSQPIPLDCLLVWNFRCLVTRI